MTSQLPFTTCFRLPEILIHGRYIRPYFNTTYEQHLKLDLLNEASVKGSNCPDCGVYHEASFTRVRVWKCWSCNTVNTFDALEFGKVYVVHPDFCSGIDGLCGYEFDQACVVEWGPWTDVVTDDYIEGMIKELDGLYGLS